MYLLKDVVHYLYLKWFKHKYPKTKIISDYFSEMINGFYSQAGQDAYIYSEFFNLIDSGKIPRVFVDIGCNHPIKFNNSYFFEKNLGFECIAIDPLTTYVSHWAETRPNAKLHSIALGDAKGKINLLVMDKVVDDDLESKHHSSNMFSTMSLDNTKRRSGNWKSIEVPILTAQDLFDTSKVSQIGIVSIDVEGFELKVLNGIDFFKTKIYIAIIENNTNNKFGAGEIRNFMATNGFTFYARIWGLDDIFVNTDIISL